MIRPTSSSSTARRSWRTAVIALVVALAQVVAFTLAPLAEARAGRSAVAHVESTGTSLHYAHNDATCAACTARALVGDASRQLGPAPVSAPRLVIVPPAPASRRLAACASPSCPRAPPAFA
ncbi:MAG: hypothetical protein ABJD07_05895 [Gemmatimonadaceae bacterium]